MKVIIKATEEKKGNAHLTIVLRLVSIYRNVNTCVITEKQLQHRFFHKEAHGVFWFYWKDLPDCRMLQLNYTRSFVNLATESCYYLTFKDSNLLNLSALH